ncbi:MAG: hypothetical protein ACR2IV_11515, partial [Bryobacteraceae bacterium]
FRGSSKNHIGSVDPDALKIPARRAESTLTEYARLPFHAEPGQYANDTASLNAVVFQIPKIGR